MSNTRNTSRLRAANAARGQKHAVSRTLNNLTGKRRGQNRVHRNSYNAGERELREWKRHNVFSAEERRARFQAITTWNYQEKQPGKPCGLFSYNTLRVLDYLMGTRNYKTGQCDPAITTIAGALRICGQTVIRAVKELTGAGLMEKLRRTQPKPDAEPDGPQVEQITNAYWFKLPAPIVREVNRILHKGRKPADQEQREKDDAEQVAAMIAQLSAEDVARFHAGEHSVLAKALAELGRAHDRSSAILPARMLSGREG